MADIQCVFDSINSVGSIFISNIVAASDRQILQKHRIKAIISIARSGYVKHKKQDVSYYLYIPAQDHEEYQIHQHFQQTYDFIQKARKTTNVLIHCMAGISRSVTIAIAYLLKKYKYTVNHIFNMIKRKRRKINPNKGFIEQLKNYSILLDIKQESLADSNYSSRYSSASKMNRQIIASNQQNSLSKNKQQKKIAQKIPLKDISYKITQNIQNQKLCTPKKIQKKVSFNQNIILMSKKQQQPNQLPQVIYLTKNLSLPIQTVKKSPNIQQKIIKPSRIQQKINKIRQKMARGNSNPKKNVQNICHENNKSQSLSKTIKSNILSINNQQSSSKWMKTTTTFPDSICLTKDKQFQLSKETSLKETNSKQQQVIKVSNETKNNNLFESFKIQLHPTDKISNPQRRSNRVYF